MSRKTPTDLAAIRRERLKILTDRFGGPYRTAKKFPELSSATLGNVLREKFLMGEPQARKIERAAGLPEVNITETAELKECPFCGEDAADIVKSTKYPENPFYVQCDACLATTNSFRTTEGAAKAWNERHP